ncbi:galactitol-1-phosphate 5-dehydrogenase [Lentibacillus kapialis]|uniref:Galactitol-1-phosphate 5-dehydrogenase n=1 Tax=Lentibacillus kapialis TaxID=340214 RepID=A0A917PY93_9BACI|nr:galactitol-1-phosphate 5-dehydrogenase [Lentibacillus kapialis]GGK00652.1 galactitol-1-phosphate 5-dehydrogenase [Lentibacillus kapialis]
MKSLRLYGKQDLRFEEADMPVLEKDTDVIIKVKAVGICGSDLSRYKKLGPYVEGVIWGHEFAGEVVESGSAVQHVQIGEKVTGAPSIVCYECEYCQKGEFSRCKNLSVIGAYQPGAYAGYIKLASENVVPLPDQVDYKDAAMIEPSAVVAHGFYKMNIHPGSEVAVMGCGNIGLIAIQWARVFGAKTIYAIDINDEKLEMAKNIGADYVINSKEVPAHEQLQAYTDGVDVAVESAGSPVTSAQVLALPKKGGEVLYMGIPYGDVPIERFYFERIVRNELTVRGTWNCVSAPFPGKEWPSSVHYVDTGDLKLSSIITHELPLKQGPEIFDRIIGGEESFGKVMFYPEWD